MQKHPNNNWLGTCRGIAVLGVLLTHFLPQVNDAFNLDSRFISAITVDYLDTGKIGVALLFLIAGYLTSTSKRKRNVKQFAVNRFFRLYPLYWFDIILVGLLFAFDGYGIKTVLANVTMLQVFLRQEDLVGLFWTLPIELLLYVGGVLLEKFMWQFKKIFTLEILCGIGTIGIAVVRRFIWAEAPVAIGLLLTIGLLGQIFRLYKNGEVYNKELLLSVGVFSVVLVASSIMAYQVDVGHQEHWWRYVLSYACAIAIFMIFMMTEKSVKIFSTLAIVAYPVYLLQEIVFRVFFGNKLYMAMPGILFIVTTLGTLTVVSVLTHLLIEKPMVLLGNRIEQKLK